MQTQYTPSAVAASPNFTAIIGKAQSHLVHAAVLALKQKADNATLEPLLDGALACRDALAARSAQLSDEEFAQYQKGKDVTNLRAQRHQATEAESDMDHLAASLRAAIAQQQ